MSFVDIVFDGSPGPERSLGFIEVEDANGKSIKFGGLAEARRRIMGIRHSDGRTAE